MSTLILYLPLARSGPATEYRYTLSADGHTATRHASASAALLPQPGRAAGEVVAVVPIRALSWQQVQLPQGVGSQSPRLRAVLEGLLEERLLDDPAQLHFALSPDAQPGSTVWVAVCERTWLREHLQALEAAGRPPARVVPEFAPGPPELHIQGAPAGTLENTQNPHLVVMGLGKDQGVAVLPLCSAALALVSEMIPELAQESAIPTFTEPAVAALAEQLLGRPIPLRTACECHLRAARGAWDLAQMDLASSGHIRRLRKLSTLANAVLHAPQWSAARWGVAGLLIAHWIGLNVWAWQEREQLAAQQAQVRHTLTETFPHIKVVVDAPLQMERELALLRQATGGVSHSDLEPLLAAAASALPPTWQASAIDYNPGGLQGELHLRGPALDAPEQTSAENTTRAIGYHLHTEGDTVVLRPTQSP